MENLQTYSSNDVVSYYEKYEGLQKPEKAIFNILKERLPEMNMLDIGIGAGRTTAHFAPLVKKYTGVDYSKGMVDATLKKYGTKWPSATFEQADVRNLERFEEGAFDFVLFSFNGMDTILPEERETALRQIRRVLKKNGLFCFSTHNLIALLDIKGFEWRLNMLAAIKRVFEVRKIKKINSRQLANVANENYVTINDGAHNFGLENCYFRPSFQVTQLKETGFSDIRIYSHTEGKMVDIKNELATGEEKWLYYLCTKA